MRPLFLTRVLASLCRSIFIFPNNTDGAMGIEDGEGNT